MVTFAGAAAAASAVADLVGAFGGSKGTSRKREADSYKLQAEAQRQAIKPLRDAYEAAGYHPLLAVGQQPFQPGGAVVGDTGPSPSDRIRSMGQAAERLGSIGQDAETRVFTKEMQQLQLENLRSQNNLLNAQATSIAHPTTPPIGGNYSVPGQGQSTVIVPREITANTGEREHGIGPSTRIVNVNGDRVRVASDDLQQAIEDGPANWYWQGTRTIPDLLSSDIRRIIRDRTRATMRLFKGDW